MIIQVYWQSEDIGTATKIAVGVRLLNGYFDILELDGSTTCHTLDSCNLKSIEPLGSNRCFQVAISDQIRCLF